jgi:hypothetical protein
MIGNGCRFLFRAGCRPLAGILGCIFLAIVWSAAAVRGGEHEGSPVIKSAEPRRGFYLHACWMYNYPFAVRTWQREDYDRMFQLLKRLGYNTVMLWPCAEAVPAPISEADRRDLLKFRRILEDGRKYGLETWLVLCAVTSKPEIAAKPWMQRSLWPYLETARLDDPRKAEAFLKHRAAIIGILNNADGYVLIDGDPGSYPGAKPEDYVKVMLHDRKTIDRVGTHPKTQKVVPWIWAGWGIENPWTDAKTRQPFVMGSLEAIKHQQQKLEPWELLPGRHAHEGYGAGRTNFEFVKKAGLLSRSTLYCYDAIEIEPSPPGSWLRFREIRTILKQERALSPGGRGWFGNSQTPILVIPNLYLFARGTADPKYLDLPDEKVLTDLAELLGGPPEWLIPAWSCLQRGLDQLPADLPAELRAAKLTGPAAQFLPGGSARYLEILAAQADSRIRLLQACAKPTATPEEAAAAVAEGTAALVAWWNLTRYCGLGSGNEPFGWGSIPRSQYGVLRDWCRKNVTDPALVSERAVKEIVERGTLSEPLAKDRIRELLAQ